MSSLADQSMSRHLKLHRGESCWVVVQDRVVAMAFQLLQAMWNKDYQATPGAGKTLFTARLLFCCLLPAVPCLALL